MKASSKRLAKLKKLVDANRVVLLFQDESEARTHPYLARTWAPVGADLRVEAPGQSKRVALLGVRKHGSGELTVITSGTKRSTDFVSMLEVLDTKYGPIPRRKRLPVVIALDNGPIHTSKLSMKALLARAHWLTIEWLPKYAPELNDIEHDWQHLKQDEIANLSVGGCPDTLEKALVDGINEINKRRLTKKKHPKAKFLNRLTPRLRGA